MYFKKKPLAVAVLTALALSHNSFADIEYTGSHTEITQFVDADINVGIIIETATVGTLDIDVQSGKKIADSVAIIDSTIDSAYIENNQGDISAVYDVSHSLANNGIVISNSTVTGWDSEDTPGVKELIVNTGDIESATNSGTPVGNGILINNNSVVTGSIINEDNGLLNGIISGGESGIGIRDSIFNGSIYNEDEFVDSATPPTLQDPVAAITALEFGINILDSTFTGSIQNSGFISASDPNNLDVGQGINVEGSTLTGDIINSGHILARKNGIQIIADYDNMSERSTLTGDIENSGYITAGSRAILIESSDMTGNINNSGTISGDDRGINLYQAEFTGNIDNTGTITGGSGELGRGISVDTTVFNGEIYNTGDISGYRGISITENVTGNLIVNQMSGTISGISHGVLLLDHRFNYTGGNINGKFSNVGGTVYIEGNRSIDGDYEQDSAATLALGLHTESSLTADNINLAAGSKVLIDLSKGDLYVSNGTSVELLKVRDNGVITSTGVDFSVNNSLVSIAEVTTSTNGNLVITLERDSFGEAVETLIETGSVSGQTVTNLQEVATVLQKLESLATNDPVIAQLLNQVDTSNMANLLPDVSGAATGSATVAASTSGTIVTNRTRSVSAGDTFAKQGMWIQGLYADAEQDDRSGVTGYEAQTSGLILGLDGEIDSGAVYGAAYTYSQTDSDTKDNVSNVDSDYHQLTGYWGYALGNVLMDGQIFYGLGDNDARRLGIGGIASADYDTTQYGIQLSSGYQFDMSNDAQITPRISVDYTHLVVDAYSETGSAAGLLSVDKQKLDRLELGLSVDASKTFQTAEMLVTPRVSLGVFHDFEAETQNITSAFQSSPDTTFTSQGADTEKNRYLAGVGVEFAKGDNLTASVEYNYNWQDKFDAHTGAVKLRWEF